MSTAPADLSTPALEDELCTLAAHLNAATARLLALVAELDRREAWGRDGLRSCAHWLAWNTGLDLGAAREHVRVARALGDLPVLAEAFGRGEISYSKVRALTRIARPETEVDLLAMAREGSAGQIERLVRAYRRADPAAERDQAAAQRESRWVSTRWTEDGMLLVEGRLTPEQGALLERALAVVMEEQLREAGPELAPVAQRQADALAEVADRALGHGAARTGGDRVQVVLHVDAEVLADPAADGRSALEAGPGVSAETSRRLACDCSVVELRHGAGGEPSAGRKSRVIPAPLRRALQARDGGCVFPGCTSRRCDGHHLRHWANGGPTTLENTCLLCPTHHTLVHEGGWTLARAADGTLTVMRPDGTVLPAQPATPARAVAPSSAGATAARLCAAQQDLGITAATGRATWDGSPVDYDWAARALAQQASP